MIGLDMVNGDVEPTDPTHLAIASCQSRIGPSIVANADHIIALLDDAASLGVELVQFPEGALSGYAKSEIQDWRRFDWAVLDRQTERIQKHCAKLGVWCVLGTAHRIANGILPHNSLLVIDKSGAAVARYDKQICSQTEQRSWYTPGDGAALVDING